MRNKKIYGFFFFTGLFLLIASSLSAQNIQELRFGSSVSGTLRTGDEIWYSIRAAENGFVVLETISDFDTILEAYDTNLNLVAEDDDSGDDLNARLEFFVRGGTSYRIKLRGFSDSAGPFRLWASINPVPTPVPLNLGSPRSGHISGGSHDWFSVRTTQPGIITVETTGNIDTYMEIYDADYKLLYSDDDSGEGNNAMIEIFTQANKTYLAKIRAYSSEESGPYRIGAFFESLPPDAGNTERTRAVTLRLGESFPVYFHTENEERWFRYDVSRNSTNFIVQTRGNIDTYMTLYDSRGNIIAEDDDSGEETNAYISERLNTGTYFIEVKPFYGGIGRCTLHAEIR